MLAAVHQPRAARHLNHMQKRGAGGDRRAVATTVRLVPSPRRHSMHATVHGEPVRGVHRRRSAGAAHGYGYGRSRNVGALRRSRLIRGAAVLHTTRPTGTNSVVSTIDHLGIAQTGTIGRTGSGRICGRPSYPPVIGGENPLLLSDSIHGQSQHAPADRRGDRIRHGPVRRGQLDHRWRQGSHRLDQPCPAVRELTEPRRATAASLGAVGDLADSGRRLGTRFGCPPPLDPIAEGPGAPPIWLRERTCRHGGPPWSSTRTRPQMPAQEWRSWGRATSPTPEPPTRGRPPCPVLTE